MSSRWFKFKFVRVGLGVMATTFIGVLTILGVLAQFGLDLVHDAISYWVAIAGLGSMLIGLISAVGILWSESDVASMASGITNLYRIPKDNPKRDERMKEVLSLPGERYSLLAFSGYNYLHQKGKNWNFGIRRHLENGTKMRVLLPDPSGIESQTMQQCEKTRYPPLTMSVSLERLMELTQRYQNLEVRLTRLPIYFCAFFSDAYLFYDPYHFGSSPDSSVGHHFLVVEYPIGQDYDRLVSHFEFLWNHPLTRNLRDIPKQRFTDNKHLGTVH